MDTEGDTIILNECSPKRKNLVGKLKDQIRYNSAEAVKVDPVTELLETRWTVQMF